MKVNLVLLLLVGLILCIAHTQATSREDSLSLIENSLKASEEEATGLEAGEEDVEAEEEGENEARERKGKGEKSQEGDAKRRPSLEDEEKKKEEKKKAVAKKFTKAHLYDPKKKGSSTTTTKAKIVSSLPPKSQRPKTTPIGRKKSTAAAKAAAKKQKTTPTDTSTSIKFVRATFQGDGPAKKKFIVGKTAKVNPKAMVPAKMKPVKVVGSELKPAVIHYPKGFKTKRALRDLKRDEKKFFTPEFHAPKAVMKPTVHIIGDGNAKAISAGRTYLSFERREDIPAKTFHVIMPAPAVRISKSKVPKIGKKFRVPVYREEPGTKVTIAVTTAFTSDDAKEMRGTVNITPENAKAQDLKQEIANAEAEAKALRAKADALKAK